MNRRAFLGVAAVAAVSAELLKEALARPRLELRPMLNLDHFFPKIESTYGAAPVPDTSPLLNTFRVKRLSADLATFQKCSIDEAAKAIAL